MSGINLFRDSLIIIEVLLFVFVDIYLAFIRK